MVRPQWYGSHFFRASFTRRPRPPGAENRVESLHIDVLREARPSSLRVGCARLLEWRAWRMMRRGWLGRRMAWRSTPPL